MKDGESGKCNHISFTLPRLSFSARRDNSLLLTPTSRSPGWLSSLALLRFLSRFLSLAFSLSLSLALSLSLSIALSLSLSLALSLSLSLFHSLYHKYIFYACIYIKESIVALGLYNHVIKLEHFSIQSSPPDGRRGKAVLKGSGGGFCSVTL